MEEYKPITMPLMDVAYLHEVRPSREMIAAMCLGGILSVEHGYGNPTSAAEFAVLCADELIAALERTKK